MSWVDAIRHEWLLQRRTLRFRAAIVAYLALTPVTAFLIFFLIRQHMSWSPGLGTYLVPVLDTQRYFTGLLAIALAGNRLDPKSLAELWPVLSAAPISNVGYVLRRTFAVIVLGLPATVMPPIVATALTVASGQPLGDPWTPVLGWVLFIVPVLVVVSALWTGMVLVAGGELAGVGLYFIGSWLIETLETPIRNLGGPVLKVHGEWLGTHDVIQTINFFLALVRRPERRDFYDLFAATDGPFDIAASFEWLIAQLSFPAGIAGFLLLFAPAFLGRTRRDLRPLVLRPDHPLRNLMRYVHGFRQRQASDGALYVERWSAMVAILVLATGIGVVTWRESGVRSLIEARHSAETRGKKLPINDAGLRVETWSVDGAFDRRGVFRTHQEGRLRHEGTEPTATFVWLLNPFLEIESVEVDDRRVTVERAWDRLMLHVDPPLDPGTSTTLRLDLAGKPANQWFDLNGWRVIDSFVQRYRAMKANAWPARQNDLILSRREPAISRRRGLLTAGDLAPAPRYASWALTPPPDGQADRGLEVPGETFLPLTELTVDLRLPPGWVLADTCGQMSRQGRLEGRCDTPLARYSIEGGLFDQLDVADSPVHVAALPEHIESARPHLETFTDVVRLSGKAWPGVPPIERLAVVEVMEPFHPANLRGNARHWDPKPSARGHLLRIPERLLVSERPLRTERIVSEMLTRSVTGRRLFDREEAHHLDRIFEALMARRMGIAGAGGAAVGESPFNKVALRMPILRGSSHNDTIMNMRLPAVVAALEGRLGRRHLFAGAEDFLDRETDERGTVEELIAALEARSGVDLGRFYDQHFEKGVLPDLRLDDVRVEPAAGGRYRVLGSLRNQGTGEVECPIEARAESQTVTTRVRVGGGETTPFALELDREPHSLLLDPEVTCYRLRTLLSDNVERIVLRGGP